jgi:hypothetical protein
MTDRPSPEREEALNAFWNDFIRPSGALDAVDPHLSPALATTIRRLHTLAAAPPPAASRERVWRGVRRRYDEPILSKESPMLAAADLRRPSPNGWIQTPHSIPLEGRPRLTTARIVLAIAAILMIALISGIAGGLVHDRLDANDPRPGPAIVAPASASPEAKSTDETLAEIGIPAGAVTGPEMFDDRFGLGLMWVRVVPNANGDWVSAMQTESSGFEFNSVVSGELSMTVDSAAQVIRAGSDGTPEAVAAGDRVELGPGDTLINRLDMDATWETGKTPVDLVSGHITPEPFQVGSNAEGWEQLDSEFASLGPVPTGPIMLRLRKVALEPDETVSIEPEESSVGLIEAGASGFIGSNSDGSITLKGATETTTVYVFSIVPAEDDATPPT